MPTLVVAIVGLPGAGKTEATNYIVEKTGWPKLYLGAVVFEELARRNLAVNEANERLVREELRKEGGMGIMASMNLEKIKELLRTHRVVILESHYSWEEYLIFKQEFGEQFRVVAVHASPHTRAERMRVRPERPLTADELQSRDYAQISNLHQAGPIARADFAIINESTHDAMHRELDSVLERLSHRLSL